MSLIPFQKMHGLGNDFVIIDERKSPFQIVDQELREQKVKAIAERHTGVGCDQLIVMRPSRRGDVYMQIFNSDGGEVASCGNATRCVAWLMMKELRKETILIETEATMIPAHLVGKETVQVSMGKPRLLWNEIPLSREEDTLHLSVSRDILKDGVAVSMGNPHAVFFVPEPERIPLTQIGPLLEHDGLFPERANINVAHVETPTHIRLMTWERGSGLTLACGTGACATMVAARRRGLVRKEVTVSMPGGDLTIRWDGDEKDQDHEVWMTGPVAESFSGELKPEWWV